MFNIKKTLNIFILRKFQLWFLKQNACEFLGIKKEEILDAVVTYFSDSHRQSTKDAGKIIWLNVLRIINELSVAYGLQNKDQNNDKNILIFDLGGGTFYISILYLNDIIFEVRSYFINILFGGEDFDNILFNIWYDEFKEANEYDLWVHLELFQSIFKNDLWIIILISLIAFFKNVSLRFNWGLSKYFI